MKKLLVGSILFFGLLSFQAHADYIPPQKSSSARAAQYSHMNVVDLQKAAKAGQPAAQFFLAVRHQTGNGVAKDSKQAFSLFKSAADQGITAAQLNVGRMYIDGDGVSKNEAQGRQYLEKAASHGDNRASFNLAMMEEQKKNYMGAYQWYELSTRDGMLDNKVINMSETKKTALAANLTPEQMRTARDRADKWIQAQ